MPCSSTSQLTNAANPVLPLTQPTTPAQWNYFVARLQDIINAVSGAANRQPVNVVPIAYAVYNGSSVPALTVSGATASLDTTKAQFGKASLKLTATAATVTVSFTGNPIVIQPFARWIESVYITSSRTSITGTLAVVTAVKSYPVDISGTLVPATWGRLYGDCDLTADDSTAAALTLTLTGCTVGDTFNLEGWQLEQSAGTSLPSPFVNSAAPTSQTALPDDANYSRILTSHTSGNVAYNYKGVWSAATAYVQGDETVYSGSYWIALTPNSNSAPAQGNGNWQVVGAYNNYQGAWSSAVTYYAGQETTYNGNYWVAVATNLNSAPTTSNANWVIAGPSNLDKIADGTGRFAVVNGAGMKGVSSVDSNNRAGIDFTQSLHVGKSLANMPDDATSGRYAVASIDGNRRALIDATQAGHIGAWNLDSRVVDGTNFQRVGTGYADSSGRVVNLWDGTAIRSAVNTWDGANRARTGLQSSGVLVAGLHPVDNLKDGTYARMLASSMTNNDFDFSKGGVNRNMGYVPDGGGRYGVHQVDGNNLAIIDFSQPAHVNKNLDNIGNGTTYAHTLASQLQNGVPRGVSSGRNLITNGGFEANVSNSQCGDGWDGGGGLFGMLRANVGASAHSGAYALQINAAPGTVIPTGSTFAGANHYGINCHTGDTLYLGAWFENQGNTALFPANLTGTLDVQIVFLDANNNTLSAPGSAVFANLTASGWQLETSTCVVPAGMVSAYMQVLAYTTNNTGSPWTVPAGQYPFFAYTDDVFCYALTNLDTDAQDGINYGRTSWNDLYVSGGYNRIGLRIAGSGHQTGDLRNLNMVGVGSLRSAWNNSPSYSATAGTPATATISFPASSLQLGSVTVSYNAMSVGVTGTGGTNVQYWLYFDDPGYSGGSHTLVATTNSNDVVASNGRVYIGSVTVAFPTSGSGGGGGIAGGGGCVAIDQWVLRGDGTPVRAADIRPGDVILGCDESHEGYEPLTVESAEHSMEPCLRLVSGGNAVTGSVHTPMTLIDGLRIMLPDHLPGTPVCTGDGECHAWKATKSLADAGMREVVHIRVCGRRYWAGEKPGAYILTHNPIK